MDMEQIRAFFMWCSIVNAGLLILTFLMSAFAGNLIYRTHSKWFPMPRETFNVVLYVLVGVFKMLFIVFSLVPYIALSILR